jgi:hypothetical protein
MPRRLSRQICGLRKHKNDLPKQTFCAPLGHGIAHLSIMGNGELFTMKSLLLGLSIAAVGAVTAAHAGSVTIGNITIAQIGSQNPSTFDNNAVGSYTGTSSAIYNGALGPISFVAGADTTGVTNGTTNSAAEPDQETTNYLWGLHDGTTVTFTKGPATSFLIWWGSIDAIAGANRYDNILALSNGDAITGSDLVNAVAALGNIDGEGTQTGFLDDQWFRISDVTSFASFTATSSQNAFEFDMAGGVPEPSTWAMMLLGFAGLGYAAFHRRKGSAPRVMA